MTIFPFIEMWKTLFCRKYAIFADFGANFFFHKYLNTYYVAETVLGAPGTSMKKTTVVLAPMGNYVRERLNIGNNNK